MTILYDMLYAFSIYSPTYLVKKLKTLVTKQTSFNGYALRNLKIKSLTDAHLKLYNVTPVSMLLGLLGIKAKRYAIYLGTEETGRLG